MDDVVLEEEEDEEEYTLTVDDLREAYIRQAARDVQRHQDVELAQDYIRRFFEAMRNNDPVRLARVLAPTTLERIKRQKAAGK